MYSLDECVKVLNENNLNRLKVKTTDIEIEIEKNSSITKYVDEKNIEEIKLEKKVKTGKRVSVKSPVVGVFYRAENPEMDPLVKVGDFVSKGDILCIVEAMKMFNDVISPCSGKIAQIEVDNGELVEFEQNLITIEVSEDE